MVRRIGSPDWRSLGPRGGPRRGVAPPRCPATATDRRLDVDLLALAVHERRVVEATTWSSGSPDREPQGDPPIQHTAARSAFSQAPTGWASWPAARPCPDRVGAENGTVALSRK